jgi:phage terminase large subunit
MVAIPIKSIRSVLACTFPRCLGAGVADRLREQAFHVVDVNVGERSSDREKYYNLRAELWVNFRDALQAGALSIPDNEQFIAEASSIKYSFDSSGRIVIEKKESMKKRGLRSPDSADSVCLTFYDPGKGSVFEGLDFS